MERDDSLVDVDETAEGAPEKGADKNSQGKDAASGKGGKAAPAKGSQDGETSDAPSERDDGSLLADAGEDADDQVKPQASWPEDWRAKFAGKDEKLLKRLERFASPENVFKSWRAAEAKLQDKALGKLPDNATDEQKAKWREERGIPKDVKDYTVPEIKGHEWTQADEPIVEDFLSALHAADTPQPIAEAALGWYAKFKQQQEEAIYSLDVEDKKSREDEYRSEWGNEYRPNLNLVARLLKDTELFPADFAQMFTNARMPDGHRLLNKPGVANAFLALAKDRYGDDGAMLTGDAKVSVSSRIDEIKQIRKTDNQRYYKEKLDEELLALQRQMDEATGKRGKAA